MDTVFCDCFYLHACTYVPITVLFPGLDCSYRGPGYKKKVYIVVINIVFLLIFNHFTSHFVDVAECPADSGDDDDDDDTLAIVLGSVFGGIALIIIIVVAVCLVKKRNHRDYEVM